MKVLLINPWQVMINKMAEHLGATCPLPVLYVAGAARDAGHEVVVIDAHVAGCTPFHISGKHYLYYSGDTLSINEDSDQYTLVGAPVADILSMIRTCNPDVIGISLTFLSLQPAIEPIVEMLKLAFPNIPIVVGGSFPSLVPEHIAKVDAIDYTVAGEGEVTFPLLLKAIEDKREPVGMPGVYCKRNGQVVGTSPDRITDLDSISYPAYDLVILDHYFAIQGVRRIQLITSRGCPFNCRFCSVPLTSKRKWYGHSPERVLSELQGAANAGVNEIFFEDENMAVNKSRFIAILEGIINNRLELKLRAHNGLHVATLDKEVLRLMKLAGFEWLVISPESGNERVAREEMGKTFSPDDAVQVVKDAISLGLKPLVNLILGMPNETMSEIQDTVAYAKKLKGMGVKEFQIATAMPMPGTELFKEAVSKGLMQAGIQSNPNFYVPVFDGPDWTRQQLFKLRYELADELNERG